MEISRKRWRIHRQSPQLSGDLMGVRHTIQQTLIVIFMIFQNPNCVSSNLPPPKKLRNLGIAPYLPIYMPYMKGFLHTHWFPFPRLHIAVTGGHSSMSSSLNSTAGVLESLGGIFPTTSWSQGSCSIQNVLFGVKIWRWSKYCCCPEM